MANAASTVNEEENEFGFKIVDSSDQSNSASSKLIDGLYELTDDEASVFLSQGIKHLLQHT